MYFYGSNNLYVFDLRARLLFLVFFLLIGWVVDTSAQVSITTPSLTITTCTFPSAEATLGDIVIAESDTADIATFGTIVFSAPSGFEFTNQGNASFSGTDITSLAPYTLTNATTITLTINGSDSISFDTITLSGIKIRAITAAASGSVTRTGGTAVIAGDVAGTVHATLTSLQNYVTPGTISFSVSTDTLMCSPANPANITGATSTGPGGAVISYQWQTSASSNFSSPTDVGTNSTDYDPPGGLTAAGYYRRIATSTLNAVACSAISDTLRVAVVPPPVVTNTATKTICSGASTNITLTSTIPSSYSWTIGTINGSISGALAGAGATINQILTNPSTSLAGSVEYIVTPVSDSGLCAGSPYTITVTVNPAPAVTNPSTQSICSGSSTSIALGASISSNFSWAIGIVTGSITGAAASSGANINQVLINPSNANSGTVQYWVTPTSTSGLCAGNPYSITVTVNPIPAVSNAATKTICSGASTAINLNASTASSFSWTIGGVSGSITGQSASSGGTIGQILTNPSNSGTGSVQYQVTPTSTAGSCVGSAHTITVTVNPLPALTNAATATICSGTNPNIALASTIASNYSWILGTNTGSISGASAGGGGSISQTLTNPSNLLAGSIEYIITPTSSAGGCVGVNDTITVTVNPAPTVSNPSTKSICSGSSTSIALGASIGSDFSWTIGTITGGITGAAAGSGATINQTLNNPSNSNSGSVAYIVTPTSTSGLCAGSPYTITVTVNPIPVVSNATTKTICSGASTAISLNASALSNFAWTIGTVNGGITGQSGSSGSTIGQTLTNPSNSGTGSVQYQVTPTSTVGSCVGSAHTITVTVNPLPALTNAATTTICSGANSNITLTATIASNYSWTLGTNTGSISGASAGGGGSISQTLTNPSNLLDGSIEYIITPTSNTGSCVGANDTITVTVNPAPAITNSSTKSICSGSSTSIALTSSVASGFSWTIGTITGGITGASASSGGNINQTLTNPSNSNSGSVEYIVTPISTVGSCVGSPYSIIVTVNPIPVVSNATTKTICSGASTAINLNATTPSNFAWTIGTVNGGITGQSASSGGTIGQILTNPSNSGTGSVQYQVTPTSTVGSCVGSAHTITVTVNPLPAVVNPATVTICSGTSPNIVLSASIASSYTWTIGTIMGGITGAIAASGATINQTLNNPSATTSGTVAYIVTPVSNGGGCTGNPYTITVTVNPVPVITNTPTDSICSGTAVNIPLTASVASNFSWTIGTISGSITGASASSNDTINQVLSNPSNTTAGTVEYVITPTSASGSCAGTPFVITVTVEPIPEVTNAATKTICSGTSTNIALSATAPSSFSWTIGVITGSVTGASAGSGTSINQTLSNPSNVIAGTVQYFVTPASASCVGVVSLITVHVNPLPALTNTPTASTCSGTSPNVALTSSVPSTFSWTIGTVLGGITGASVSAGASINQTLVNPSTMLNGSVEYIVTPTSNSGSCQGAPTTITVTVIHAPMVTNAATATVCSGVATNIPLTANEPSTFSWTIGAIAGGITGASASSGATITQTLTNPSHLNAGTVEYLVTPTSSGDNCAGSVFYITVTVNPAPEITNALTAAVCSGSVTNVSLTASIPSSFAWTIGNITGGITGASASSGVTIAQTLTNPSSTTPGTVEYIVTPTATTGSCVGAVDTVAVTVNVAPIAIITGGTAQTVCSGIALPAPITFSTSNSIAGTTFTWTRNDTVNVTGATSGTGAINGLVLTNTTALPRTVTFTIIPTGPTPTFCVGTPITTTLVVDPVPSLISSLTPAAICTGDTFSYTPSSTIGGTTYTWSRAMVADITPATSSGNGSINETLANASTSPVSVTYVYELTANGCTNPTQFSVVVAVNVYPSLSSTLVPAAICSGSTFSYIPQSLTPSTTFTWQRPVVAGITNPAGNGVGNPMEVLTDTLLTSVEVKYIYTSEAGGCINPDKDTVVVTVKPTPELSSTLTPSAVCSGAPFSYTPSSLIGGAAFSWTRAVVANISNPAGSGTGAINETLVNTSSDPVSVTYVYTITANGCSYNQNVVVVVNPIPVLTSSLTPPAICSGTLFSYNPQSSTTGATFTWSRAAKIGISNGPANGNDNPNETLINTTDSSIVVEYVYAVSANGCNNLTTYTVQVPVSLVPSLTSSLAPPAICGGTTFSYIPTSNKTGTIFSWTRALVPGITNIAGAGTFDPNEPLTNITDSVINVSYIYTLTANGCSNPTTYTVVVPVYPTPSLSSSLNPPAVCSGSSFNYTVTSTTSGTSFTWTRAVVSGISNGAGSGTGDVSEVLTNTTTEPVGVTYIYTASANGCAATYNVNVTVNPIPAFTSTLAPAATCSGALFNYVPSSSTLGATYTWIRAAVAGISNPADTGVAVINEALIDTTVNPVTNVTYVYKVSANGCTNPGDYYVTVTVNPIPVFTSSANAPAVCSGATFGYTPTSSTSGTSFAWTRNPVTGISNIGGSGNGSPNEALINTTTDSVNVTYIYILTANGCTNPIPYSVVVAVNASPVLSSTLFPPAICSGDTFSYTPQSLTPNTTFVWNRPAVAGIYNVAGAGINNPNEILYDTTAFQQNVTYIYTLTAKGCSANTNVVVTVNPSPVLTSSLKPPAICSGTAFNYNPQSSTVGATFSWSRAAVTGIAEASNGGIGNPNEVLTNTTADTVNVTYVYTVSANTCTNSQTFSVVVSVYPVPAFTSSHNPPDVCSGIAFAYVPTSTTTGTLFTWTRAAIAGISNLAGNGTGNPNEILNNITTAPVTVKYVYTTSFNGCANPVKDTVRVNVIPTPALTSTASPSAVCSYSEFVYAPTSQLPGVTFSWTRPAVPGVSNIAGSGTDSISEVLILSDTIPVNVTYYYTLSTSSCTNPVTFPVVVTVNKPCICNHQLTSTLTPTAICNNTAFSYAPTSSSSGATFSWTRAAIPGISNPAATGNGNPNETLIDTTALPVDVTYVYSVTADGCTNPAKFNVVVRVNPTPALSSTLAPPAICSGTTFTYTPTSETPGTIFNWTRAAVAGISNPAGNGAGGPNELLTNTTNAPEVVTYVYTVSANGCTNSTLYSVAVTVNPKPTLNTTLSPPAICSGTIFSYTPGSETSGTTFNWNRAPVSGISQPPASGTDNPNETLTNLTTFPLYVSYEYTLAANGCSNVQYVMVTVEPIPLLSSSLEPTTICSGTAYNYTPTSQTTGASFSWTRAAVAGISNIAGSGNGNPAEVLTNTSTDPVSVTYEYTLTANACSNTTPYNVIVTVNPIPVLSSSLAPVTICSGTVFSYNPESSTDNASFVWTRPAAAGIGNPVGNGIGNPNEILYDTLTVSANTVYEFVVSANGCTNPTPYTINVTVDPFSLSVDAGAAASINVGSSVMLNGSGGATYLWSPLTGVDNPTSSHPYVTPLQTTTYTLTVTDGKGCVGVDSVTVTVIPDQTPVISNIMTPNGDGKNDTWIIVNIENYPNTEVTILNNQGQKIFESTNYQNDWDGTYNGKPLPDATYYYFLKYPNNDKVYSGAISIFHNQQ